MHFPQQGPVACYRWCQSFRTTVGLAMLRRRDFLAWAASWPALATCRALDGGAPDAATGKAPAIWVADADGTGARRITRGIDDLGADHPRWL